jgi:hypothetical protein
VLVQESKPHCYLCSRVLILTTEANSTVPAQHHAAASRPSLTPRHSITRSCSKAQGQSLHKQHMQCRRCRQSHLPKACARTARAGPCAEPVAALQLPRRTAAT